jgi:YafQ family addiction module toxin component
MQTQKKMNYIFSLELKKILEKIAKKDKLKLKQIESQVYKIISNPLIGKPLRNIMKNYRRVHIGAFVLIYKIENEEITFADFEHHDKIYKKYKF